MEITWRSTGCQRPCTRPAPGPILPLSSSAASRTSHLDACHRGFVRHRESLFADASCCIGTATFSSSARTRWAPNPLKNELKNTNLKNRLLLEGRLLSRTWLLVLDNSLLNEARLLLLLLLLTSRTSVARHDLYLHALACNVND